MYADARVRDLTGARRDATALWALLSDTLPGNDVRLVVDGEATITEVRCVLDATLGAAGPDDTVIVSFSGHGSHDHRLAVHDTVLDDLAGTTISMDELAARFRATHARAVLCILDCCFSGGAPARVLEDSPIPREPGTPIEALAGEGRLLIAACKVDELSYEHPGARHGLLTKAIIDVLRQADGLVSLTEAMDRVQQRVRADAQRMGVGQTPVLFGHIVGGLSLPALRPGARFHAAFPETRGVRIGPAVAELTAFGLPEAVLTAWADRFTDGLNDLQLRAVNDHRVLDGCSLLVVAPTSSGKTFIGELAATRAVVDGRKAVFLLPYRALVNEKFDQFSALYGDRMGMRVIRCTGDYTDQTGALVRGKYDLALLTYEMFLNLVVGNPAILQQIGLVVVDEAQFITDPNRGITVELLLTYLLAARERGIAPQLVALSAVIGDTNDFDGWLGCEKLVTHERPVRLVEGVLDRSGVYQFLDEGGQPRTAQLLPVGAVRMRRDKPSAQDMIVPLVRQLVAQGEQVIVFRNQRGAAEGCARYLAAELGLPPAQEAMAALPTHDLTRTSADLRACLAGGTAFHNTNLLREERITVERAFRDPAGQVRVLAATTTVAAGINTPASTVILAEQEFIGEDGRPFTVAEYKNMAGRAGRLGFKEEGKSIILADSAYEREQLFRRYVRGQLEPLRSSFEIGQLDTWVVRLLAQVKRVPRRDVTRLLTSTYGGYCASRGRPAWRAEIEQQIEALLERMVRLELVEQDGDDIQLTLLGRACGSSGLRLASSIRLVELLRKRGSEHLTAEELMALLQGVPEPDSAYTPLFKKGRREAERVRQAAERYGPETVRALQYLAADEWEYFGRCKRAAVLWDWVHGRPIEEIEREYSTTPYAGNIGHGDIRRFADATRFHLRSAHQIASAMFVGQGPSEESVEALLKQLETGLPTAAVDLLALPLTLTRGEYLALVRAGVSTVEAFWALSTDRLQEIIGLPTAARAEVLRPAAARPDESSVPTGCVGQPSWRESTSAEPSIPQQTG